MSDAPTINWQGRSGTNYKYWIYPSGTNFKEEPGNYIYAKETSAGRWSPVYIGQTKNLNQRLENHNEKQCVSRNGATHVHVHLNNAGEQARKAEEKDLIVKWEPPCNEHYV